MKTRNLKMTKEVLSGATFKEAAKKYGFGSKQSAQHQFRLTVVNLFWLHLHDEIVDNDYDVKYLRRLYREMEI